MHDGFMGWHWGFGFGHWGLGLLFWALVIAAAIYGLRLLAGNGKHSSGSDKHEEN